MISFNIDNVRFNYKVSGVAINNGRVLLTSDENIDYWYLPGGRVEVLETTCDALQREMQEELGQMIEVGRLVWVVENFFNLLGTPYHEIGLIYLMRFKDSSEIYQYKDVFEGTEPTIRLYFKWFDINKLESVRLFPVFLKSALTDIPQVTEHIVVRQ